MYLEILILIVCLFYTPVTLTGSNKLNALWNLDAMGTCKLGYQASVYNNYGCWCGVGGSGKPMDGIDRAVLENRCYDTAEEYLLPYHWKCIQNQTVCLNDENSKCGNALCACDTEVIKCWSRFEKPKIEVKCVKTNHSYVRYSHSSFSFVSLIKKIFSMWKREVI